VFSIYRKGEARNPWFATTGFTVWPIPQAALLLRLIAGDRRLIPTWMTCWGDCALFWNMWSKTRFFPVSYHLTDRQDSNARLLFPELYEARADEKLIAVRYHLRRQPDRDIVWLEDEFSKDTHDWAASNPHVTLLDASRNPVRSLLLSEDEKDIHLLMALILGGQ